LDRSGKRPACRLATKPATEPVAATGFKEGTVKIRHPLLIKMLGRLIAWTIRLWLSTVRYRCRELGPRLEPNAPDLEGRYIYIFWHETMLLPAYQYRNSPVATMISEHADGEMIARAIQYLGLGVVRGSSTRGSVRAVREMIELKDRTNLCITPDGPRGPRQEVQPGVVFLASRTGLPVVPVGFVYKKAWRMNSWDRFGLPWPFTKAVGVFGEPIYVPPDANKGQLEEFRQRVEDALKNVTRLGEEMVQGGRVEGRQKETVSAGPPLPNGG
jgi:lysophospholipid acyltransferase (LPLAT)-like uncharacterized protein